MLTVNTINRQIICSHNTPESALNGCKYIRNHKQKIEHYFTLSNYHVLLLISY